MAENPTYARKALWLTMFLFFSGYVAGRIIFALLGKFSVMCSFDAIFVFSSELFPTVIRYAIFDFLPSRKYLGRSLGSILPRLPFLELNIQ